METARSTKGTAIYAQRLSDVDVWVVRGFLMYISIIIFTLIISFHIGHVAIVGSKLTFYLRR
jgi:hypothetical protein